MNFMEIITWPAPGKYIVAVSGGVDSVVLLHLLKYFTPTVIARSETTRQSLKDRKTPDQALKDKEGGKKEAYELIVAHADHGWRAESKADADFVRKLTKDYGLPCEVVKLKLKGTSEAEARKARYDFLESTRKKHHATAIITAHHLDDCIETAVFNLLRGTGIYGMSSLRSTPKMIRPLLDVSKQQIIDFAKELNLSWREDESNINMRYSRNRIRHELMPKIRSSNPNFESDFKKSINRSQELNDEIVSEVSKLIIEYGQVSHNSVVLPIRIIRQIQLPVLRHVLIIAIRMIKPDTQLESATIQQAALHLKTERINRLRKLNNQLNLSVQGDKVNITCK